MVTSREKIAHIHWVRHKGQAAFHAYASVRPGASSVCGRGEPFTSIREMDIPGDRSMCCQKCCVVLYGPSAIGRSHS